MSDSERLPRAAGPLQPISGSCLPALPAGPPGNAPLTGGALAPRQDCGSWERLSLQMASLGQGFGGYDQTGLSSRKRKRRSPGLWAFFSESHVPGTRLRAQGRSSPSPHGSAAGGAHVIPTAQMRERRPREATWFAAERGAARPPLRPGYPKQTPHRQRTLLVLREVGKTGN